MRAIGSKSHEFGYENPRLRENPLLPADTSKGKAHDGPFCCHLSQAILFISLAYRLGCGRIGRLLIGQSRGQLRGGILASLAAHVPLQAEKT